MNGAFSNWLSLKNVSSNKYFSKKTLGIFSHQIFLFHDVSVKTTHALFSETMRGLFSFYGVTKVSTDPRRSFLLILRCLPYILFRSFQQGSKHFFSKRSEHKRIWDGKLLAWWPAAYLQSSWALVSLGSQKHVTSLLCLLLQFMTAHQDIATLRVI